MEEVPFSESNQFTISDPGMYGIESILLMKHTWFPGHDVVRGALVHDRTNGRQYFVTDNDLRRYLIPPKTPVLE